MYFQRTTRETILWTLRRWRKKIRDLLEPGRREGQRQEKNNVKLDKRISDKNQKLVGQKASRDPKNTTTETTTMKPSAPKPQAHGRNSPQEGTSTPPTWFGRTLRAKKNHPFPSPIRSPSNLNWTKVGYLNGPNSVDQTWLRPKAK